MTTTARAEFRILHISDLHIGNHNAALAESLTARVERLKPHVILATGDLADSPNKKHLLEAKRLLDSLASVCVDCASAGAPRLIVLPGNHDKMFLGNVMVLRNTFKKVFGETATSFYYPEDRVWIYALDSARAGIFGANGFVPEMALSALEVEYLRLQKDNPERFTERVFKIVALHHHPLPVNDSNRQAELQRWLTLMNAGALLGAALTHEFDLILHGHEHIDARSTFRSSFGGKRDVHVVSVGATLKNGGANYMNLVRIGPEHQVEIETFQTAGAAFDKEPVNRSIRSVREARDLAFETESKERGYYYREVASTTILSADGDCRRIVECDGLDISKPDTAQPHISKLRLAATTGEIDLKRVAARRRRGRVLPDLRINIPTNS